MTFYVTTLEPIVYKVPNVNIGANVTLSINSASKPVRKALRMKLSENPQSMLITELGKQYLFNTKGSVQRDASYYRP